MGALFWVLLAVAAVLCCALVFLVIPELRRRSRVKMQPAKKAGIKPAPEAPPKPVVQIQDLSKPAPEPAVRAPKAPEPAAKAAAPLAQAGPDLIRRSLAEAGPADIPTTDTQPAAALSAEKEILRKKYDTVKRILRIPPDAALVSRRVDIFCLTDCDILHYCWTSSTNLYFFPQWESVEKKLDAGAIKNYRPGDEAMLLTQTISKAKIEAWRALPDGGIEMKYFTQPGQRAEMQLEASARPVFETRLPEKEISYFIKHVYPRSSQNIFDIKSEFLELKQIWESGSMSDAEYAEGKKYILLTM